MYKALIFDFDYTLGDSTPAIVASINYALGRLGYPAAGVEEIRRTIGLTLDVAFRILTGVSDRAQEILFFDYFQIMADEVMTERSTLFPGVEALLREWSKRYRLGIVSSKHRFRIVEILKKFSLENVVNGVVGNEDVAREKPDSEGLVKAAELLGTDRREVLYIGDNEVDAQAAADAGIDFAAVLTGTTPREVFEKYPHVLISENLSGIREYLSR